ncbi:MAG: hypothetical protein ABIZ04_15485 [Opitutus sp.]
MATALIIFVPLAIYSSTVFAEFGLRDDYSILREAHEERGTVFEGCAAQARPIYGVLLEFSFARLRGIADLSLGRLCSAILLGAAAALSAVVLHRILKWPLVTALLASLLLTTLPGAQIIVSWSICWPFSLAIVCSVAAFATAQMAWSQSNRARLFAGTALAFSLLVAATLIYPSETLVYVVFVVGLIPLRRHLPFSERTREFVQHALLVGGALSVGFLIVQFGFVSGHIAPSARIAFETDWADKLVWLGLNPIRDALGLYTLDDLYGRTDRIQGSAIALVAAILVAGCWCEFKSHGWRSGLFWTLGLVSLCLAALSINLLAAERWAPYRTLLAESGVILFFSILSLENIAQRIGVRPTQSVQWLLLCAVVVTSIAARHQTRRLIAEPQMAELQLVRAGSTQIDPRRTQEILILRPWAPDQRLPVMFDDEFGSLSSNSDWTPKEMIKDVLRERFPEFQQIERRSHMMVEWIRPVGRKWDIVVDLRFPGHTRLTPLVH